jgi:hypothetical protein
MQGVYANLELAHSNRSVLSFKSSNSRTQLCYCTVGKTIARVRSGQVLVCTVFAVPVAALSRRGKMLLSGTMPLNEIDRKGCLLREMILHHRVQFIQRL